MNDRMASVAVAAAAVMTKERSLNQALISRFLFFSNFDESENRTPRKRLSYSQNSNLFKNHLKITILDVKCFTWPKP